MVSYDDGCRMTYDVPGVFCFTEWLSFIGVRGRTWRIPLLGPCRTQPLEEIRRDYPGTVRRPAERMFRAMLMFLTTHRLERVSGGPTS
jgi:hypothetical protein